MSYDIIIGLEIHTELQTKTKMFCRCQNGNFKGAVNTNVCPICLGHPGTLPSLNHEAVDMALLLGLALNGQINSPSKFDRKNYFYPDLPKGYQISQYDLPIVYKASLEVDKEKIDITRIHLEEDTGKLTHPASGDHTLIDFNRAGTPLIEMVTEPVIKDAKTAKKFCQKFRQIVRYLNISQANMEKGEMRCEANISLQVPGTWVYEDGQIKATSENQLNPKVEVKNINSFRSLEKAIDFEIARQTNALDNHEVIKGETRGWSDSQNKTFSQRTKESSADYRYFPEPDLPALNISPEYLETIRQKLIELPDDKCARFIREYKINGALAEIIVAEKNTAGWFEELVSELNAWVLATDENAFSHISPQLYSLAANWFTTELLKYYPNENFVQIKKDGHINPNNFAKLLTLIYENKINSSAGQTILLEMTKAGGAPDEIMEKLGLKQLDDNKELEEIIKKIISKNPKQVEEYRGGKETLIQFFVGQVMAESRGRANPQISAELLKKILNK